jgi:hypothetical protein
MERHFRPLCDELANAVPGRPGAVTFYEQFRNGLAHLRGPKSGYGLARDIDNHGKYVEIFNVEDKGQYIGINVDRLYLDFTRVVNTLRGAT